MKNSTDEDTSIPKCVLPCHCFLIKQRTMDKSLVSFEYILVVLKILRNSIASSHGLVLPALHTQVTHYIGLWQLFRIHIL